MTIARDRGIRETPVPSAARTVSGASGVLAGYDDADSIRAQLNVTAAAGVAPTLDVVVEDSIDGGATWNVIGTFTQAAAVTRQVINITIPFGDDLRIRWTIGGTTPSFTFAVDWFTQ